MNKRTQAEQVSSTATHRRAFVLRAADGGCLRAAGRVATSVGSAVARAFYNLKG